MKFGLSRVADGKLDLGHSPERFRARLCKVFDLSTLTPCSLIYAWFPHKYPPGVVALLACMLRNRFSLRPRFE
jgi:hypothetical protein